ncbi:hypothetical protein G9F72_023160 [Clostridium estertheticum]|uniref:hypothetical protein n=1 Tax=Clostridium estertheticum TaxID=238834 RepID=UPI0013E95FE6|nr:hypothetical protein [Clostridium estertheticum]MBZ9689202.1 hypothetical protein [Clostridium estertheticum]
MKKARVIIAAAMVTTMLVGAGYASWTDALTVNSTVSTGELKVQFDNSGAYPTTKTYYYVNGVCSPDTNTYVVPEIKGKTEKELTINFSNMYPGALALYEAKIDNKGTIPAVFDYVNVEITGDGQLDAKLDVYGAIKIFDKDNNEKKLYDKDGKEIANTTEARWFYCKLNTLETTLNAYLKGINLQLEPGDYATFDMPDECRAQVAAHYKGLEGYAAVKDSNCINFWLAPEITDCEKATATLKMTINFKQHNIGFTK